MKAASPRPRREDLARRLASLLRHPEDLDRLADALELASLVGVVLTFRDDYVPAGVLDRLDALLSSYRTDAPRRRTASPRRT